MNRNFLNKISRCPTFMKHVLYHLSSGNLNQYNCEIFQNSDSGTYNTVYKKQLLVNRKRCLFTTDRNIYGPDFLENNMDTIHKSRNYSFS